MTKMKTSTKTKILLYVAMITIMTSCFQKSSNENKNKLVVKFNNPEELVECFYKALNNGDNVQLSYCMGEPNSRRIQITEMKGINYKVIKKEIFNDSIKYSRRGDMIITTKEYFLKDAMERYLTISKLDTTWIISEYTTQLESEMLDAEQKAIEALDMIKIND